MSEQFQENLISIIVPVYNAECHLAQCIESIINQKYSNLQIILVDDGSTDQSGKICDEYVQKDSRVQIIHRKNGGPTVARQTGLDCAMGKYIGFVDADDYIDNKMFYTLYNIAEQYQAKFVHSGYFENAQNKIQCTSAKPIYYKNGPNKELFLIELFSLYPDAKIGPALWCNLFERTFILNNYKKVPLSQSYGEDLIAMCHCIINSNNFVIIPDAFYHYSIRSNSISNDLSVERLFEHYTLYNLLYNILIEHGFNKSVITALKKRFSYLSLQILATWNNYYIPKYKYPKIGNLRGKKVLLYGSGKVGQDYYFQISKYQFAEIVGWADQEKKEFPYATVEQIKTFFPGNIDLILIAVFDEKLAQTIKYRLLDWRNDIEIIWDKPILIFD